VLDAATALGIPVTMYGLDVFYDVRVDAARAGELMASPSAAARLAGGLIDFQCRRFAAADATIGDAGAVCAVAEPVGLTTRALPVRIELAGSWTRGQTVVDQRDWAGDQAHDPHGPAPSVIDVALGIDAARYASMWLQTVTGQPPGGTGVSAPAGPRARSAAPPPG
jgi:pyrimidine-specific ribonucleoside hydrolase